MFEFLLSHGASPTLSSGTEFDDMTALHLAAVDTKIIFLEKALTVLTYSDIALVRKVQTLAVAYGKEEARAKIDTWLLACANSTAQYLNWTAGLPPTLFSMSMLRCNRHALSTH